MEPKTTQISLTFWERMACRVMSRFKYKDDGNGGIYYKCLWNNALLSIARLILGGKDPVEFCIWLATQMGEDEKEARELMETLRYKAR